jgi:uncharacterized protein with PQ loop repeat
MGPTNVLAVIVGGLGIAMGASPLLQALRSRRRKSAADVSLAFLCVLLAGGIAWLLYGIALGNAALVVANGVGAMCSAVSLAVTLYWRRELMGGPRRGAE